ncbi:MULTISPECIES: globin domain-containing protein [Gordonia]|uniref:nitric oxide dioxygenase n=2 Tax=Gordonia TaxID=2053 RepID=L7LLG7_9ACTN|nr:MULTISPECIES: globin domain-containing protein [Gordonia]AUH69164.1 hemin transporter [Gordonia sp. YC-JH1]KJR04989.1 hemin transporter [Gordonia sihwensis]KXT57879.1 hemin transporter [Gordonia sp. QH-12]MBY4569675.1 hemin transporter [Gordonia sihwensis]WFN94546.1 FAD-binding oxidoreductase [Gordonia sihwensis]
MISSDTKLVLEATVPVVEAALPEITPRFYDRMFTARPELLRDLFNRTNQATGGQPQVLAGAVAAFARLQLEPDAGRMRFIIDRIAHKHASLGIVADQYPIVHEHLFAAIVDVLGEAVTPEVAAAWDELYWEMAHVLIGRETELYRAAGVEPGDVWKSARVVEREQVAPDAVAFTLESLDGEPLGAFVPGQYISVQATMDDGARQIRQYSLTGSTSDPAWHISVKLDGEVSSHLHEHVFEGDLMTVSTPFGDLTLPEGDDPLLLASAGIGCTPVIGLLNHLVSTGDTRPVTVLHADRSRSRQPHRGDLAQLVDRLPQAELLQWYEHGLATDEATRIGYMDLEGVDIAPDTTALLCGPSGFLGAIRDALLERDVPEDRIHYESFSVMK